MCEMGDGYWAIGHTTYTMTVHYEFMIICFLCICVYLYFYSVIATRR